jgi:hypothetical protein
MAYNGVEYNLGVMSQPVGAGSGHGNSSQPARWSQVSDEQY